MKNEKRGISFGLGESNRASKSSEPLQPCTGSLFETIERFPKEKNMVRIFCVYKPERLLAINNLIKINDER